jgi:hypothetical protein
MNYFFQFTGLIINGSEGYIDYSRFVLPTLHEGRLDERLGIFGTGEVLDYGTRYWCQDNSIFVDKAYRSIDWDCSGDINDTDVQADISGNEASDNDGVVKLSNLHGFSDWEHLVYDGGWIGSGDSDSQTICPVSDSVNTASTANTALTSVLSSTNPLDELPIDEIRSFYKPYAVAFDGGQNIIATAGVSLTIPITLTNTGGLTTTVSFHHEHNEQGWFDLSNLPISTTLAMSDTFTFPITLTIPVSLTTVITNSVNITATPQESPLMYDTQQLNVHVGPLAWFEMSTAGGAAPLEVNFFDRSIGDITSYQWDFGDSNTSQEQNPTHTYTQVGKYNATLTVTGTDGSHTYQRQIFVGADELVNNQHSTYLPLVVR